MASLRLKVNTVEGGLGGEYDDGCKGGGDLKDTGKYHIMALHFPIAFLIGAAVVQWYLVARGKRASVVAVLLW